MKFATTFTLAAVALFATSQAASMRGLQETGFSFDALAEAAKIDTANVPEIIHPVEIGQTILMTVNSALPEDDPLDAPSLRKIAIEYISSPTAFVAGDSKISTAMDILRETVANYFPGVSIEAALQKLVELLPSEL